MTTTTDGRGGIDAALVERLVAAQFPQWAGLPVRPVELDGWDNRTYRLGDDLTVRLPSHPAYAAAVAKEQEWLPRLAPYLPVPVPVPVGRGRPGCGYPLPWTVNRWLPGSTADPHQDPTATKLDQVTYADAIAQGLRIMDQTAFALCGENKLPMVVFGMEPEGNILRVVQGEKIGTLVSADS